MVHPPVFDEDDPLLARLRELAEALPEAKRKVSFGRQAFYTKNVFAYYGASEKVDGHWVEHPTALCVLVEPDERLALVENEGAFIPAYLGPWGWVAIDLTDDTDWTEVEELLDESWRLTAPAKIVAARDAH